MPVAGEVPEVQRIGELHPETARIGDDPSFVHEEPGRVERLPAPEVLGLEGRHPQPAVGHGAIRRPLAPGGIGQPRVAPARHHVDVDVQGLLHVAELGNVLEEDAHSDHRGGSRGVRTREGVRTGGRAGRPGTRSDLPLEIAHHVDGRRFVGERRGALAAE